MDPLALDSLASRHRGIAPPSAAALTRIFALGRPLAPLEEIHAGMANAMWKLHTDDGFFAVKGHAPGVSPDDARRSAEFEIQSARAGVPTAVPQLSSSGSPVALVGTVDGREQVLIRVHRWLPAGAPVVASPGVLLRLGEALGCAHAAALATEEPIGEWQSKPVTTEQWAEVVREAGVRGQPWARRLASAAAQFTAQRDLVASAGSPRERIWAHGDLSPTNTVNSGVGFKVIDWDGPCPLAPTEELAMVAAEWLFRGHRRRVLDGSSLMDGYHSASGRSAKIELRDFGPYLAGKHNWVLENTRIALGLDVGRKWGPETAAARMLDALERTPTRFECERLVRAVNGYASPEVRERVSPGRPPRR